MPRMRRMAGKLAGGRQTSGQAFRRAGRRAGAQPTRVRTSTTKPATAVCTRNAFLLIQLLYR